MISPVELCRVQAGGTSDYSGCRDYFPELRSCFVLHSTGKHNNTWAIGYTKTVHIAYAGILCIYHTWESTQHLTTAPMQNYHSK